MSDKDLRERIRQSTKEEVILEEMIRLGYWPEGGMLPNDPADQIRRRSQLRTELRSLRTEESRVNNVEGQINALRKQRLQESREQRQANKVRREQEKKERAAKWKESQQHKIVYLGEDVSPALFNNESDALKLQQNKLTDFSDEKHLAESMGIDIKQVRFLAFNRKVSKVNHYRRFTMKKKSGGERQISAPRSHLKKAQHWILENILNQVPLHDAAHGFCQARNIISNAQPHVGCSLLINIDLENFFPTFTYKRVKGVFRSLGYSEKIAAILGLLSTEAEIAETELDGELWYVACGERLLPQGAPTSPAITNIICRHMDQRLAHLAGQLGFTYTRYADDMTFSSKEDLPKERVGQLMRRLNYIIAREGMKINRKKTRIVRQGGCREVTGLVVNEKISIPRKKLRAFRSVLFQIEKDGPQGKKWGTSDDIFAAVKGYAHFIYMVDPEKGADYIQRINILIAKHGWEAAKAKFKKRELQPLFQEVKEQPEEQPEVESPKSGSRESGVGRREAKAEKPVEEKKPWWKFW